MMIELKYLQDVYVLMEDMMMVKISHVLHVLIVVVIVFIKLINVLNVHPNQIGNLI